ncbi:MAG: hypothetical protein KatS3mg056_3383 [Chloroflexus sp.]|nr:MAG: hypothetical protein KatS3mg056_3383 [Chloroflexus sp.]
MDNATSSLKVATWINGTIVGGLVGLIIYSVSLLFS